MIVGLPHHRPDVVDVGDQTDHGVRDGVGETRALTYLKVSLMFSPIFFTPAEP